MERQATLAEQTNEKTYTQLSFRMASQLAAPHTWPAAILPVLLSVILAATTFSGMSIFLIMALLFICILMQSSVNTFNDYYDFVKGADSLENQHDPSDAVLVYNNIKPRLAFLLALGFLGLALLLGIYVIISAGWIPLLIGCIGTTIIVLYSAGKSPLSYLPVGEYVSAVTMGGLVPLACYQALTGSFSLLVLLFAFPLMCGIGLIMFTNNTCDIEKDSEAGRKTQSVLLGRKRARKAYHLVIAIWILSIILIVGFFFTQGLIILLFMLLIVYPALKTLVASPLTPETRRQAMASCLNLNIMLGAFYITAILFGGAIPLLF